MTNILRCPGCDSLNKPDAPHCRVCGRKLRKDAAKPMSTAPVVLERVMSGEVFTAVLGKTERGARPAGRSERRSHAPEVSQTAVREATRESGPEEDDSDVILATVERIRARAEARYHPLQLYARPRPRGPIPPTAKKESIRHLRMAAAQIRREETRDAIRSLERAISFDDEDPRSWLLLADAYLKSGDPFRAAPAFLRALELRPRDQHAWLGLARVLRSVDDLDGAAAVLDRAVQLNPQHADAWEERARILEALHNATEAIRSLARVVELRPDHPTARSRRDELERRLAESAQRPEAASRVAEEPSEAPREARADGDQSSSPSAAVDSPPGEPDELDEPLVAEPAASGATRPVEAAPVDVPIPRPIEDGGRARTYVEGLDRLLDGGIPSGHVVLLEGAPGTMKSSLAFSILLNNAMFEGKHCLYVTLEERAASLLKQMASIGFHFDVAQGSLIVLDPQTASDLFQDRDDWVEAFERGIEQIKAQRGMDMIAIDSLEALEVLAKFKDRRREIFRLFEWLRDLGVTSILISERPDWVVSGHVLQGRWDEDFLADGVIHLRLHLVTDLEVQRRIRVVKMRGTKHESGYLAMVLDDGRFRVTRAMSP